MKTRIPRDGRRRPSTENLETRTLFANLGPGNLPVAELDSARPNIVLINVDDMRADALPYMQHTLDLLGQGGTTFNSGFVPTALSGPSRASLFSGLYAHNTGVLENRAPLGGEVNLEDRSTLATWLNDAGYSTGHFGKNNEQAPILPSHATRLPAGWDHFETVNKFYGFTLSINGNTSTASNEQYSTDVLADRAAQFIAEADAEQSPLFLYFAPYGAHAPYQPARRHEGDFETLSPARPPSHNVVADDNPNRPQLTPQEIAEADQFRIDYFETLLSVDEAVRTIYQALEAASAADNTIFVFMGDNGLAFGEHAVQIQKHDFYEESVHIPFIIKDGRSPLTHSTDSLVLNIDVAPTLMDMAGLDLPKAVDGESIASLLDGGSAVVREEFLLEDWYKSDDPIPLAEHGPFAVGLRTKEWKFAQSANGTTRLYDLASDPYELDNVAEEHPDIVASLRHRMNLLRSSDRSGPVIPNARLNLLQRDGQPQLVISGRAVDRLSQSEIRSPEYFIDELGSRGSGSPLDTVDGRFDSPDERFQISVPAARLAELSPGSHTLFVRGRDIAGNWGESVSLSFQIGSKVNLIATSDTGDSNVDITIDDTPTFTGLATPGKRVTLFKILPNGAAVDLGSTVADDQGVWRFTAPLSAGAQRVFAWHVNASGKSVFSAAMEIHLVGKLAAGKLVLRGTSNNDVLRATTTGSTTRVFLNQGFVGSYENVAEAWFHGGDGDDVLTYQGSLPAALLGEDGNDQLRGGSGNDLLVGGNGDNRMRGGVGSDRYQLESARSIVSQYLVDRAHADRVWEFAGQGNDVLDFSRMAQPLSLNAKDAILANIPAIGPFLQRTVSSTVDANSFEEFIGGAKDDRFEDLHLKHTLLASPGEDSATILNRVTAGSTTTIRTLALATPTVDQQIRVRLRPSTGNLRVDTTIEGGITSAQVSGNGTAVVTIVAFRSAIARTLRNGVSFTSHPAFSGLAVLRMEQLGDENEVMNLEETRVSVASP